MNDYVYIGRIVNTHGIKGEIRILSDFKYKDRVFKENVKIYIGDEKQEEIITSYRHHKVFEMITMKGYNDINMVLKFMKKKVYVKRETLGLDNKDYLDEDLINLDVKFEDGRKGKLIDIENNGGNNKTFIILLDGKKVLVPYHKDFIINIDLKNKLIELKVVEGLL